MRPMNTLEIKGNWNIAKGILRQKWGRLTDDEPQLLRGQEDELLGRIQKRAGQNHEIVKRALRRASEDFEPTPRNRR